MNTSVQKGFPVDVQHKYRENFARYILGVSLHLQSEIMNVLTREHGHSRLRINFEPYIAIAAGQGARLSDIAELLGISRQAANQTANQIEAAGYLQRAADPSDRRAKLLVTTPRAKAMIRQGAAEATQLQDRFADIVGARNLARASASLGKLNELLGLLFPFEEEREQVMAATLPRLSDYTSKRLQALTMARGHPHLKRSFGAVLTAIGPRGGRIQQIANSHDVSKQAISAVVSELEKLGYIKRDRDPGDARQLILRFTGAGEQLIADSVASVDELAGEFRQLIGQPAFDQMVDVMARIYQSLHLEEDVFGQADRNDIHDMARQINRQLGEDGAKALARLLLSGTPEH